MSAATTTVGFGAPEGAGEGAVAPARRVPLYASRLIARSRAGAKANRLGFVLGLLFGALLVLVRVHEYQTIHDMLMLRDPYVFLLMGSAVGTAMPLLWLLRRRRWVTPFGGPLEPERNTVERKHIAGSAVFGAGWAITGACPGPLFALLGSGVGVMAVVAAAALVGTWTYGLLRPRLPH